MKNLNTFLLEGLKISRKSKIEKPISTFRELADKYGDPDNINNLEKFNGDILLDNKYDNQINKIYNVTNFVWCINVYPRFRNKQNIFNMYPKEYEISAIQCQGKLISIRCKKLKQQNQQELTYIEITRNKEKDKFELSYDIKEYPKTEESLIKAFEYLLEMDN